MSEKHKIVTIKQKMENKMEDKKAKTSHEEKMLSNIAKLTDDEKKAIVSQWADYLEKYRKDREAYDERSSVRLGYKRHRADSKDRIELSKIYQQRIDGIMNLKKSIASGTISDTDALCTLANQQLILKAVVNGENVYFDKDMKRRKPTETERYFGTFVQCLKDNGFSIEPCNDYDEYSFLAKANARDEIVNEFAKKNFFKDWELEMSVISEGQSITVHFPKPHGFDCIVPPSTFDMFCFDVVKWRDTRYDSIVDSIRQYLKSIEETEYFGFMKEYHGEEEFDANNENLFCATSRSPWYNWDDLATRSYDHLFQIARCAARRKFSKACKDFLKAIGKSAGEKKSGKKYGEVAEIFIQCLKNHGFAGKMAKNSVNASCDIMKYIPSQWAHDFNSENSSYFILISKKNKYGERGLCICPRLCRFDKWQFEKMFIFRENDGSFIDALKELTAVCAKQKDENLETFMREAEKDARLPIDMWLKPDNIVQASNLIYNYNDLIKKASYKDFYDVLIDFLRRIGETWEPAGK